jgi:toxin HigB-1
MIKSFADKRTQQFYITGAHNRIPSDFIGRAKRKLSYLDLAENIGDLQVPPSNRFHKLEGKRKEQFAIRINDQWRICFRFIDGDAYDVEITDYH